MLCGEFYHSSHISSLVLGSLAFCTITIGSKSPTNLYAQENVIKDSDKIHLHGLQEDIKWSSLDRWDYSKDPNNPTPPEVTLYTGMNMQEYFVGFFCIMMAHFVVIFVAKCVTARDFRNKKNKFRKIMHVCLNMNFSYPYKDWDDNTDGSCSKEEYQRQFR